MRAAFLEAHDEFEGVGAHELNPRYDHVDDGDEYDHTMTVADAGVVPAFVAARTNLLMSLVTEKPRLDGIDISHYQYDAGPPNWASVAGIPTWWAATKLTQSTGYLDPTAARSRTSFLAAGMTHRGLYHWLSSTTDPQAQAAKFLHELGLMSAGEFAMLDAEEGGITQAETLAWCEAVEAVTHRPVAVYTGAYVAGGTIWQSTRLRESKFGPRPFILAAYTSETKARALPGVAAYPWQAWQFSSNGPVAGITGRCDMDRIDDRAAFDLACALTATAPPPIEHLPTPAALEETDMPAFTHSDADHDGHPARFTFWALMPDGTKRHVTEGELAILGTRDTAPAIPMALIDGIPDQAAPIELTGELVSVPTHLTGTIDLRSAT